MGAPAGRGRGGFPGPAGGKAQMRNRDEERRDPDFLRDHSRCARPARPRARAGRRPRRQAPAPAAREPGRPARRYQPQFAPGFGEHAAQRQGAYIPARTYSSEVRARRPRPPAPAANRALTRTPGRGRQFPRMAAGPGPAGGLQRGGGMPTPFGNGMPHAAGAYAGNGARAAYGVGGAGGRGAGGAPPMMAVPVNMGAGPEGGGYMGLPGHGGVGALPGYPPMQLPYALVPGQGMQAMQARALPYPAGVAAPRRACMCSRPTEALVQQSADARGRAPRQGYGMYAPGGMALGGVPLAPGPGMGFAYLQPQRPGGDAHAHAHPMSALGHAALGGQAPMAGMALPPGAIPMFPGYAPGGYGLPLQVLQGLPQALRGRAPARPLAPVRRASGGPGLQRHQRCALLQRPGVSCPAAAFCCLHVCAPPRGDAERAGGRRTNSGGSAASTATSQRGALSQPPTPQAADAQPAKPAPPAPEPPACAAGADAQA